MRQRYLALLSVFASLPAMALTYQTRLENIEWTVAGDKFECRLTQPITDFGSGEFVRKAGEQAIFRLNAYNAMLGGGSATLLAAAAFALAAAAAVALLAPSAIWLVAVYVLLGIYTGKGRGRNDHTAVFLCEEFSLQQPTDRWEIVGCAFFRLDNLPEGTRRGYRHVVAQVLRGESLVVGNW